MTEINIKPECVLAPNFETMIQDNPILLFKRMPCMYYPFCFKKDQTTSQFLIESRSEFNAINLAYTKKLGCWTKKIDVEAQKIDSSILSAHNIVITRFEVLTQVNKACFFQETLLLANTSDNIILKMHFLTFSNVILFFANRELT